MPMIDAYLAEFDHEAATTRRLLERVPADKLGWKPHEKSMTLGQLANHLSQMPGWMEVIGGQDELDFSQGGPQPEPGDTPEAILESFDRSVETFKRIAPSVSDDAMGQSWKLRDGEKIFVDLPRAAAIRTFILNHVVHHRGQLSVYLRLLDVPLPSIYGPSADDNVFA
jgi:uncharacterized damage-inducible protein DinB